MPERVKLSIKLTIEADADLDVADTLEVLKENLENFQYTIGVKRIDVKMDEPRKIYDLGPVLFEAAKNMKVRAELDNHHDRVMDILKAVAAERVERACRIGSGSTRSGGPH